MLPKKILMLARKQRGDFRKTTSSSPGLHGYAHKSNDPAVKEKQAARGAQRGALTPAEKKQLNREEFDIFETVLEFLYVEGYAETLEEAEWMMANLIDEEAINIILGEEFELDEAEGSYGATPKAYSAAKQTKMSAKRKPFLKKMLRRTNPANRTSSYDSPRKGLTSDDRERARAGSAHGVGTRQDHDYPSQGPGGVTKSAKKLRKQKAMGEFAKEEFELWVNELVDEGYDLSDYTWDEMLDIYLDEAEGSYGQTPKAKEAMGKLANDRRNKPASEYSQKGEKTRKVKAAEKQTKRQDMLSRGLSGGKKSSRPFSTRGKMDADERTERRSERAFDLETKYGEGSVTKNPKKLRKQKAMGEIAKESFEAWLDEAMTNYEKNRKRAAQRAAARNEARAQGKTGAVPGVGYVTPRKERETWTDESGKTRHAKGL